MSLQKLLSTPRGLLYKTAFSIKGRPGDTANINHVIRTPPRVRIPFTEKIVLASVLVISMWATPAWVIYHMPEYKKVERNVYVGQ